MLNEAVTRGAILIDPPCKTKEELFRYVAKDADSKGLVTSEESFYQHLVDREKDFSTIIAAGKAIPHARCADIKDIFCYLVVSHDGLKFKTIGSKVQLAFVVGAPRDTNHYLELLAIVSRMLKDDQMVNTILGADKPAVVQQVINELYGLNEEGISGSRNCYGLFMVINDEQWLEQAMELAIELGVSGATALETTNVASKVALQFPFMSFLSSKNRRISSKTIFGIVEKQDIIRRLYTRLKKAGMDLRQPGAGSLFIFPLAEVFGAVDEEF